MTEKTAFVLGAVTLPGLVALIWVFAPWSFLILAGVVLSIIGGGLGMNALEAWRKSR